MAEFIPIGKSGIYGKLSLASDLNAPLVICYGGINWPKNSNTRSGTYMYNYFDEAFMKKYHLYVAYSDKVSGNDSYATLKRELSNRKIVPSYEILYLFSGGYRPALDLIVPDVSNLRNKNYELPFKKIYLVDILIGNTLTWVQLAEKYPSKFYYVHTSYGHNNNEGSERIIKVVENESAADHMQSNIPAVNHLIKNNNPPWPKTTNNAVSAPTTTNSSGVISIGDEFAKELSVLYKEISFIKDLTEDGISFTKLVSLLKKSIIDKTTKKVIVSLGYSDKWSFTGTGQSASLKKSELFLELRRVYPNAEFYILNGSWGWSSAKADLRSNAGCDDNCWSKQIDAYILNYTTSKFSSIGTKTKLDIKPDSRSSFFLGFSADLKKYKIITSQEQSIATSLGASASQAPIGQEVSRGDLNNSGEDKSQDSQKNQIIGDGIVNIFRTKLLPDQIKISTPIPSEKQKEFINLVGFLPLIWYNAYQIDIEDVQYFGITYEGILPVLNMTFHDTIGIMKDTATPVDNSKITIFISSRSDTLRPLHIQFKITTYSNNDSIMSISGLIDIDGLYFKEYKTFKDSTSNKALQDMAKAVGLGFNTNIVETNDRMNWLNTGLRVYEFMNEILQHSYISDESFVSGNVDLFYNFNFVDVQKELSRNVDNDIGTMTSGLGEALGIPTDPVQAPLFLTSDESLKGNNNYFSSFKLLNRATDTALEYGYYDNFIYYDTSSKKTLDFDIHSMNLNADKSLVLKGGPSENFYQNNKNFVYAGKTITDNSHVNFNYSNTHNNRNIFEAEKIAAELELPFPNYNINRFQKIKVLLSHNVTTLSSPAFNARYSGDWLILDIKYLYYERRFKQVVTLVRRELGLTDEEIESGVPVKDRPVGRGNFRNPTFVPGIIAGTQSIGTNPLRSNNPLPNPVPETTTPTTQPSDTRAAAVPSAKKILSFGKVSNLVPLEGRAFLDLIAYREGTAGVSQNGYDIMYAFKKIQNWTENFSGSHPNVRTTSGRITSSAAGRYQFLYDVWRIYGENKAFNKVNQDTAGWNLIVRKRSISKSIINKAFYTAKNQIQTQKIDYTQNKAFLEFLDVASFEWASLPASNGTFRYSGQGSGKIADVYAVFIEAVRKYS